MVLFLITVVLIVCTAYLISVAVDIREALERSTDDFYEDRPGGF